MCVDTCKPSSSYELLPIPVRDVEKRIWIPVLFGKAKVDHVDLVASVSDSYGDVLGLDIAMDEGFFVYVFNTGNLVSE
jgi:hypothetical protein